MDLCAGCGLNPGEMYCNVGEQKEERCYQPKAACRPFSLERDRMCRLAYGNNNH